MEQNCFRISRSNCDSLGSEQQYGQTCSEKPLMHWHWSPRTRLLVWQVRLMPSAIWLEAVFGHRRLGSARIVSQPQAGEHTSCSRHAGLALATTKRVSQIVSDVTPQPDDQNRQGRPCDKNVSNP